jgi:hypothetical protein
MATYFWVNRVKLNQINRESKEVFMNLHKELMNEINSLINQFQIYEKYPRRGIILFSIIFEIKF